MWHSIKTRPTAPGIYVVAEFRGNKMVDFHPDYALVEGYWGPNCIGSCGIIVTHWMRYSEYRDAIEKMDREDAV